MNDSFYEDLAATLAAEEAEAEEASSELRTEEEREEDASYDAEHGPSGDYLTFLEDEYYRLLNEARDLDAEAREFEADRQSYWAGLW
jgi:hypothetical protein